MLFMENWARHGLTAAEFKDIDLADNRMDSRCALPIAYSAACPKD